MIDKNMDMDMADRPAACRSSGPFFTFILVIVDFFTFILVIVDSSSSLSWSLAAVRLAAAASRPTLVFHSCAAPASSGAAAATPTMETMETTIRPSSRSMLELRLCLLVLCVVSYRMRLQ